MSATPVRWAERALEDFDEALAYLAKKDERVADRYLEAVLETVAGLAARNTGRPGRVPGSFEKSMPRYSYVISFTYRDEVLYILRVIHTARDWPAGGWPED